MPYSKFISLKNVRTHNLKGINVDLPIGKWIAVTGVSGSGKSSLAFDTLYSESQRRFLETLGTYERQFLAGLPQGEFDSIDPVPPAIALKQTHRNSDPRSVIATTSDMIFPLRTLFSSLMNEACSTCGGQILRHELQDFLDFKSRSQGDFVLGVKLELQNQTKQLLSGLMVEGYSRIILGKQICRIDEIDSKLFQSKNAGKELKEKPAFLVMDILGHEESSEDVSDRMSTLWDTLRNSDRFGTLYVFETQSEMSEIKANREVVFHIKPWCDSCVKETKLIDAGDLDWQSALGSCKSCEGLGNVPVIDVEKVIPNTGLSLKEGAIKPFTSETYSWAQKELIAACKANKIPVEVPYADLSIDAKNFIWNGNSNSSSQKKKFVSVEAFFEALEAEKYKATSRIQLARYRKYKSCPECLGARIGPAGRKALALSCSYDDIFNGELLHVRDWLSEAGKEIRRLASVGLFEIHRELTEKINLLCELGLGSSSLSRRSKTLSGGEYQRVLLCRVLGNGLTDALYVLDEPSIGLGAAEIPALIDAIKKLRDQGNTIVMVEHDTQLIHAADQWIELGPEGGQKGGFLLDSQNLQSAHLGIDFSKVSKRQSVSIDKPAWPESQSIRLHGFSHLNCENLFLEIPLGKLTVIGGPSGAGKSTLIKAGLDRALRYALEENMFRCASPDLDEGRGIWQNLQLPSLPDNELFFELVSVDQRAAYRSISSVPATVLGLFDHMRKVFASTEAAKERGLVASDFSFNGKGGCVTCAGKGFVKDDLFFLGEVEKECEVCLGLRYRNEVLEVKYKGRNISEWLNSSIDECVSERLFAGTGADSIGASAQAHRSLMLCGDLGIGHLPLGIPSSQISGGEAQRLRIAATLTQKSAKLVCLIAEPSRGLSEFDIGRLLTTFQRLCKMGHTIVVVEHHSAFQRVADQFVVMGPGSGTEGGKICERSINK